MGRKRKGNFTLWRTNIPSPIALEFELAIVDPRYNKPIYGLRSQIVTQLVIEYIQRARAEGAAAVAAEYYKKIEHMPTTTQETNDDDN